MFLVCTLFNRRLVADTITMGATAVAMTLTVEISTGAPGRWPIPSTLCSEAKFDRRVCELERWPGRQTPIRRAPPDRTARGDHGLSCSDAVCRAPSALLVVDQPRPVGGFEGVDAVGARRID